MSAMKEWAQLLADHHLTEDAASKIVIGYYNRFLSIHNKAFPIGLAVDVLEHHLACRYEHTVMNWMHWQYKRATVNAEAAAQARAWALRGGKQ